MTEREAGIHRLTEIDNDIYTFYTHTHIHSRTFRAFQRLTRPSYCAPSFKCSIACAVVYICVSVCVCDLISLQVKATHYLSLRSTENDILPLSHAMSIHNDRPPFYLLATPSTLASPPPPPPSFSHIYAHTYRCLAPTKITHTCPPMASLLLLHGVLCVCVCVCMWSLCLMVLVGCEGCDEGAAGRGCDCERGDAEGLLPPREEGAEEAGDHAYLRSGGCGCVYMYKCECVNVNVSRYIVSHQIIMHSDAYEVVCEFLLLPTTPFLLLLFTHSHPPLR